MLVCNGCNKEWSGSKWARNDHVGKYFWLCKCGSKKNPREEVDVIRKAREMMFGGGSQYRSARTELKAPQGAYTTKEPRVLVISDLHLPFPKKGYLKFLKSVYDKYDCNTVVQMGDIIDGHYESRHPTDPHALNAEDEFDAIIPYIEELCEAFPEMYVLRGNHCRIVERQATASNISPKWIKSLKDRLLDAGLKVEGWTFDNHFVIDGIKYVHGEGRKAKNRMTQDGISVVQGHYHSESYVHWLVNDYQKLFAMQLGALIDDNAYAFAYGKHFAKSHKNCGVVINGVPTIEYMEL